MYEIGFVMCEWCVCLFQHLLYRSLGTCLVMAAPPEQQRLPLLNDTWKVVMKLKNPAVSPDVTFTLIKQNYAMQCFELKFSINASCDGCIMQCMLLITILFYRITSVAPRFGLNTSLSILE